MTSLAQLCEAAMREGRRIDLTGCYHEISGQYAYSPTNYYPLLAGLAKTQRMTQVLDVGTNYGGSILAVRKGLADGLPHPPVLVTLDVAEHPGGGLGGYPEIIRILGDAASPATAERAAACFRPPIDMVYLDAVHTREHTRACFDAYAERLQPRFLVLDDIYLNDSMERLWADLVREFPPEQVFDATDLTRRGHDCGFGVIQHRAVSR